MYKVWQPEASRLSRSADKQAVSSRGKGFLIGRTAGPSSFLSPRPRIGSRVLELPLLLTEFLAQAHDLAGTSEATDSFTSRTPHSGLGLQLADQLPSILLGKEPLPPPPTAMKTLQTRTPFPFLHLARDMGEAVHRRHGRGSIQL